MLRSRRVSLEQHLRNSEHEFIKTTKGKMAPFFRRQKEAMLFPVLMCGNCILLAWLTWALIHIHAGAQQSELYKQELLRDIPVSAHLANTAPFNRTPFNRAPYYSRDEVFYKLAGGCTDAKGYFWAEGFFLAIDGFRQNPVGSYWDTMWVCNQRGFSIDNWNELDGQTINMFPNVFEITNDKGSVCRHMRKFWGYETGDAFAEHYLPCYNIPSDSSELEAEIATSPNVAWVQKPKAGTGGAGVRIVEAKEVATKSQNYVQYYVNNPLLIKKKKFDIRLYVLVASVDPLVVYVHRNAFLRFSMVDYDPDPSQFANKTMHVTNMHHQKFQPGYKKKKSRYDRDRNPWHLMRAMEYFEEHAQEYGDITTREIWDSMKKAVVNALLALREPLAATPCDGCYQVFGADLVLDDEFKSYLIEWNTTPSIERDSPNTDGVMLLPVYADTFRIKNIQVRSMQIDSRTVREALRRINILSAAQLRKPDEKLFKLLCSHIHMFYYRGGFDLAWPMANSFSEYENLRFSHKVYPLFRRFIAAYPDLSPFFKDHQSDFFAHP